MNLVFVTDQHHMDDLEQRVVMVYGRDHAIRLIGDISPSHILKPEESAGKKTTIKLFRELFKQKKKVEDPRYEQEELPVNLKMESDRDNIMRSREEDFMSEWVCHYGGVPIANLARKYFVHAFSKEPVICLSGNEYLMDHAQRSVYQRIMTEKNVPLVNLTEFVLKTIKEKKPEMYKIISSQLKQSGIEGDIDEFILKSLNTQNYNGDVPLSSSVFRGLPNLERFKFKENVCWEKKGNCVIVYVPYFNNDIERHNALNQMVDLMHFLESNSGDIIIAYHGNPYPEKMEDEKAKKRHDYNSVVINDVASAIFSVRSSPEIPKMVCGHLHESNRCYTWNSNMGEIELWPLGIKEIAVLDTDSGKLNISRY